MTAHNVCVSKNLDQMGVKVDQVNGQRVIVTKNGLVIADLHWEVAQNLGKALIIKGEEAEKNHWDEVEKKVGHLVPIKKVLGMPVVETPEQVERLG